MRTWFSFTTATKAKGTERILKTMSKYVFAKMIQTKTEANFANFTGKHLFNKVADLRKILPKTNISYPLIRTRTWVYQGVNVNFSENFSHACNFIKRFQHRCFPVIFAKFFRTSFFTEHLRWLLLICESYLIQVEKVIGSVFLQNFIKTKSFQHSNSVLAGEIPSLILGRNFSRYTLMAPANTALYWSISSFW